MSGVCKGCGAPIRWALTPAGKKMPLDAIPREKVLVSEERGGELCVRWAYLESNHFETCPAERPKAAP